MLNIQRMISPYNHYDYNDPRYLVFHYIGAKGTARNNAVYFYNGDRQASAHYYIGEIECWQGTEDFHGSWAVGNTRTEVNNTNSINIEMECANDSLYVTPLTEQNSVELGAYLMKKHNIPIENVRTHYEVTGGIKVCPNWSANDWERWKKFKKKLVAELDKLNGKGSTQQSNDELYRIRKSWSDVNSQIGAFKDLENAKKSCKSGYSVFDNKGNKVHLATVNTKPPTQSKPQPKGEYIVKEYSEKGKFIANESIYFRNKPYVGSDNPTQGTYSKGESVIYDKVVQTNKYVWISWISASTGKRRYLPVREVIDGVYKELWGTII